MGCYNFSCLFSFDAFICIKESQDPVIVMIFYYYDFNTPNQIRSHFDLSMSKVKNAYNVE